jgi:hypothetical protein
MKRCLDYAEALRELWPPSVVVPDVAGSEQIRFPFAGGYASWGCATPIFIISHWSLVIGHSSVCAHNQ